MAKKNLATSDPIAPIEEVVDPVAAASAVGGVNYRVIGHGCYLPTGEQLGLGYIFDPIASGLSEAQVIEMVNHRDIELEVKVVSKPYTQEVVTKGAVGNGGSANC